MLSRFKKTLAVTALVGMSVFPIVSEAALINSLLPAGQNTIEDSDVERVLDSNGAVKLSGSFAEGDVIQSILRFTTTNGNPISDAPGLGSPYQLDAYSELKVVQIIDLDGLTGNAIRLIFGATNNLGAGVLANVYERTVLSALGYNASLAPLAGIAAITGLPLTAQLGLGSVTDFWFSDAIDDIAVIAASPQGAPQNPNGAFALSLLSNPGGMNILEDGVISPIDLLKHDVIGGSSIYAKESQGINAGWLVSSNTYATFASVPEPSTLALLGLGFLGFGLTRRRKS